MQQSAQLRSALLQGFDEKTGRVQLLRVWRGLQHLDGFLVGSCFLFGNVFEPKVLVSRLVREQHAVVERVLTAQVMSQNDVRQFVREHHGQTALIGEHVDQPAAYYDRVTDAESFQR